MEKITKTAHAILHLVDLITCICKTHLIIVYFYNIYQLCVFFSNKQSIYLSIYHVLPQMETGRTQARFYARQTVELILFKNSFILDSLVRSYTEQVDILDSVVRSFTEQAGIMLYKTFKSS